MFDHLDLLSSYNSSWTWLVLGSLAFVLLPSIISLGYIWIHDGWSAATAPAATLPPPFHISSLSDRKASLSGNGTRPRAA